MNTDPSVAVSHSGPPPVRAVAPPAVLRWIRLGWTDLRRAGWPSLLHGLLVTVASLEWKHRIILVNETHNEEKVLAVLEKHTVAINDRDIVWFILKQDIVLTNYAGQLSEQFLRRTRERYGVGQGKVILIGKDGGIKSRSDRLDIQAIFSTIDAMPMSQREMLN
jgi:hypothetical protein